MTISLKQAKNLQYGDILHCSLGKNADGTPYRFRVTGKVKTWKRDVNRIRVPLKRGLYEHAALTNGSWEGDNITLYLTDVSL